MECQAAPFIVEQSTTTNQRRLSIDQRNDPGFGRVGRGATADKAFSALGALDRLVPYPLIPGIPSQPFPFVTYAVIGIVVLMSKTSEVLTSSEFATIKRVSARRIRTLASTGRIPGARKRGRDWLIPAPADIDAGKRGPLLRTVIHTATVRAFKRIAELDRFQRNEEIATAVKVQRMKARDRVKWLRAAWERLQRQPLA
jgi:hypothetical protein